jgi:hypothetical protein
MLVYNTPRESWWWWTEGVSSTPSDIRDIQEKLDKLWIAKTPETSVALWRIQADPRVASEFSRDLSAALNNPSETKRLEILYLKGFWQILNIWWVEYTYAKIAWMPEDEQMKIIGEIAKPLDKIKIGNYLKELAKNKEQTELAGLAEANQKATEATALRIANVERKEAERAGLTEANQRSKEAIETNRELEATIKNIQSINWVLKPTPEELKKNAQNIPELKWVPIEEIQWSTKYDNILIADYYIRNASDIEKDLKNKGIDPEDIQKFNNSINSLSDTLKRPRIVKFEILTKQILLWENRDKIESRWKDMIERGYNKEVIWNSRDRTITFTNKAGEQYVIDTTPIPPRERIVRNGLSIDQAIPEESKESVEYKKTLSQTKEKQKKNEKAIGDISIQLSEIKKEEFDERNPLIKDAGKNGIQLAIEARKNAYKKLETHEGKTEDKITAITEILEINQKLKIKNAEQISPDKPDMIDISMSFDQQLGKEEYYLNDMKRLLSERISIDKELKTTEKNKPKDAWDNFESIAKSNLSFLIDLGYDKIGQDTLDKVVASLNAEYQWVGNDTTYVDLWRESLDNQQKQRILLGLTRLMHVNGQGIMPEWDNVNNDDQFIAYRQTRSPLWNVSLQELWKKPKYQSLVNNPDITKFRNQVVWREKPPEKPAEASK